MRVKNKYVFSNGRKLLFLIFLIGLLFSCGAPEAYAYSYPDTPFQGSGKKSDPFLINDANDLLQLSEQVNGGRSFSGCWFLQTQDINLANEIWTPIGEPMGGSYFLGFYNGGGHVIRNVNARSGAPDANEASGLFGYLGGTVYNLGLENQNGRPCVFALKSAANESPYLVNCYSQSNVYDGLHGGIADQFSGGTVINSWSVWQAEDQQLYYVPVLIGTGIAIDCLGFPGAQNTVSCYNNRYYPSEVTAASQRNTLCLSMSCVSGLDADMLIPWVQNREGLSFSSESREETQIPFAGEGTRNDPYRIGSYEELAALRDLVNGGQDFEGRFFAQTADIEINTNWIPIGLCGSEHAFKGNYNGGGHTISGLRCEYTGLLPLDRNGLFGQLGGVVYNLSCTEVAIVGDYSGVIASSSYGDTRTMAIINCYTQGKVTANRAAGIAESFQNGLLAGCISDVEIELIGQSVHGKRVLSAYHNRAGGITARSLDTKVYGCYAFDNQIMPDADRSKTSWPVFHHQSDINKLVADQNVLIGLIQQLFGYTYQADLIEIQSLEPGKIVYGGRSWINRIGFLNEYGPFLLMTLLMPLCFLCVVKKKFSRKTVFASLLILGAICLFMDCAAIGIGNSKLSIGRVAFLVQLHMLWAFYAVIFAAGKRPAQKRRLNGPLLIGLLLLLVLELLQFKTVPRYDASIYYGSLSRGAELYRLDPLTFIGAFVCWKWAHGAVLLLAPLEFLFHGNYVGVYVANLLISEISLFVCYRLFKECIPQMSDAAAVCAGLILAFSPFQLGMFTYLCFDSLCVYFAFWLMYAYKKNNTLLTSFCGFLLFFTKISGGVFYVVFLVSATIAEIVFEKEGKLLPRLIKWWSWPRVIAWVFPGLLYLASVRWGEWLTIQHFNGANVVEPVAKKAAVSYLNTLVQAFGFGFRWLFVLFIILALIALLLRKSKREDSFTDKGKRIAFGAAVACLFVVILLLFYNSDAECPRYTALQNVAFTVLFVASVYVLFQKEWQRTALLMMMSALLLIQTYWSIDPLITKTRSSVDTGTKELYRIALDDDDRLAMNLGSDFNSEYPAIGDIYAYNIEYNLYDELLSELMKEIQPEQGDAFLSLDIISYEFHLNGNQYPIYWNKNSKRFTYVKGEDCVLLGNGAVSHDSLIRATYAKNREKYDNCVLLENGTFTNEGFLNASVAGLALPDGFYLVVAPRIADTAVTRVLKALDNSHYENVAVYSKSTRYGSLEIYQFERKNLS